VDCAQGWRGGGFGGLSEIGLRALESIRSAGEQIPFCRGATLSAKAIQFGRFSGAGAGLMRAHSLYAS